MKKTIVRLVVIKLVLLFCIQGLVFANSENLCRNVSVRASSVFQNDVSGHSPTLLFDGRHFTGWGPAITERSGWVEFDLEKAEEVSRVVLDEGILNRIRGYVFKARRPDGDWVELVRGERIGYMHEVEFPAITARTFRLEVTRAVECPGLWEIELYSIPAAKFANPREMAPKDSLDKFRSLKLGAWIIWGPQSLTGQEISFCRGVSVPQNIYDNLYKKFDPQNFDPQLWIRILKKAGFKYVVYVPKHHDGFCLWETKTTDYNIMNSPFGRDIVKELVETCKKEGMDFNLYYSIADSYNPDYVPAGYTPFGSDFGGPGYQLPVGQEPDFDRYVTYMKTHLKELSDIAGPCLMWWFDGSWSFNWTPQRGHELYAFMRKLQPKGLFSNRIGCAFNGDVYMPTWFASEEKSFGDYVVLEVDIPRFNRDTPWEYTRPASNSYSWSKTPTKPGLTYIDWAVKSACGDGNFLLATSILPDGTFDPRLIKQLDILEEWLGRYGESIYATRGGPYKRTIWYGSTCNDNTVYLHVFKTDNGKLILPPLAKRIINSSRLGGGKVDVQQTKDTVIVTIDPKEIKTLSTIVVLKLDGNALDIEPIEERPLSQGAKVTASSVNADKKGHSPEMASDGDISTWWQAEAGAKKGWLEYDLGQDRTFSRAVLFEGKEEAQYNRIRHIQIQAKIDGQWKTLANSHEGLASWPLSIMAPEIRFVPTTARYVRLNILRATDSPIIHEFTLYER